MGVIKVGNMILEEIPAIEHKTQSHPISSSILLSAKQSQKHISQMTLDTYRIISLLDSVHPSPTGHTNLIIHPTPEELLSFLANGLKEVRLDDTLLVYISGDHYRWPNNSQHPQSVSVMNAVSLKDGFFLSSDFISFTRRNMILIVDCGTEFRPESTFGQKFIYLGGASHHLFEGSFYTFFISYPVKALSIALGRIESVERWADFNNRVRSVEWLIGELVKDVVMICGGVTGMTFIVRWMMWNAFCQMKEGRGTAWTSLDYDEFKDHQVLEMMHDLCS